jgi:hypothetical protein
VRCSPPDHPLPVLSSRSTAAGHSSQSVGTSCCAVDGPPYSSPGHGSPLCIHSPYLMSLASVRSRVSCLARLRAPVIVSGHFSDMTALSWRMCKLSTHLYVNEHVCALQAMCRRQSHPFQPPAASPGAPTSPRTAKWGRNLPRLPLLGVVGT